MAFDSLQEKLTKTLRTIQGKAKLSDRNMEETLEEIRIALLDSDVNYRVAQSFLNKVKEEALGKDVLNAVEPGQLLVKIVHDEIINLLGDDQTKINYNTQGITTIMLVGLQGTGKTTHAAKIANQIKKKENRRVMIIAADVVRPAAIEQLKTLASKIDVEVFSKGIFVNAVNTVKEGMEYAKSKFYDTVIIDTAGRLQIDEAMMQELVDIKEFVKPQEILLTVDALTGQDIVNVANEFNEKLNVTGLVVTKFDGDSKGGAVLSVRAATGVPIKFTGVGEKIEDLEPFYPDRLAQRILGMGDVVSLVEKAQDEFDEKQAEALARRMFSNDFNLDDLVTLITKMQNMGPFGSLIKMMPGMGEMANAISDEDADKSFKQIKAIVSSMTPEERRRPDNLRSSHKRRIAAGSGTSVNDVSRVLNQFEKTKKAMKSMSGLMGMMGLK